MRKGGFYGKTRKMQTDLFQAEYMRFYSRWEQGRRNGRLDYDEYETIRLIDRENMNQLACAEKMGVSRSTAARIYGNARKKLADALVGGKALKIDGGDVIVCAKMRPECKDVLNCCHKKQLKDA